MILDIHQYAGRETVYKWRRYSDVPTLSRKHLEDDVVKCSERKILFFSIIEGKIKSQVHQSVLQYNVRVEQKLRRSCVMQ